MSEDVKAFKKGTLMSDPNPICGQRYDCTGNSRMVCRPGKFAALAGRSDLRAARLFPRKKMKLNRKKVAPAGNAIPKLNGVERQNVDLSEALKPAEIDSFFDHLERAGLDPVDTNDMFWRSDDIED